MPKNPARDTRPEVSVLGMSHRCATRGVAVGDESCVLHARSRAFPAAGGIRPVLQHGLASGRLLFLPFFSVPAASGRRARKKRGAGCVFSTRRKRRVEYRLRRKKGRERPCKTRLSLGPCAARFPDNTRNTSIEARSASEETGNEQRGQPESARRPVARAFPAATHIPRWRVGLQGTRPIHCRQEISPHTCARRALAPPGPRVILSDSTCYGRVRRPSELLADSYFLERPR